MNGSNDSLITIEDTVFVPEMDLSTTEQVAEAVLALPGETESHTPAKPLYTKSVDMSDTEPKNEEQSKACVPLSNGHQNPTSQDPSTCSLSPVSKGLAFQPPSPNGSSGNISAAPFQAVQTVFKVNAPLPPRKEFDLKDESPYPVNYNQSYTTASTQTGPQSVLQPAQIVDQAAFVQESLSGPGAPDHVEGNRSQRARSKEDQDATLSYQPDGTIQMSNGNASFYPAQGSTFVRNTAPYINCRGSVRGAARGGRGLVNSYRSPSGYKGFDGYRGGPPLVTNGNCGQPQYCAREYPGVQYVQRDGSYQQGYKRATSGGQRPNSRGANRGNSQEDQWMPNRGRERGYFRRREWRKARFPFESQLDAQKYSGRLNTPKHREGDVST